MAALLKASAYDNASVWFSPTTDDFLDAGIIGVVAPYTPGDETWKFKTVQGCSVASFTSTQRTNMRAKNCNFYETTQGVPMTEEGQSASGKYSDLVRYLNYLQARVGERVFGRLAAFPKVPYTDEGIAVVAGEVSGQLQEDEKRGAIASGWTVSVPKAAQRQRPRQDGTHAAQRGVRRDLRGRHPSRPHSRQRLGLTNPASL